jgi:Zn finger protein HypA/HybF involved in hydrogenase expression
MGPINGNQSYAEDCLVGMRRCRECGEMWVADFMPAVCTKCGAPLADQSGPGFEPCFSLFEQAGFTAPAFHCEHCGRRIYEQWTLPTCPHCNGDISHMIRRSRRIFLAVWRRVSIYWRIYKPIPKEIGSPVFPRLPNQLIEGELP